MFELEYFIFEGKERKKWGSIKLNNTYRFSQIVCVIGTDFRFSEF